jgi:hypothetical protein
LTTVSTVTSPTYMLSAFSFAASNPTNFAFAALASEEAHGVDLSGEGVDLGIDEAESTVRDQDRALLEIRQCRLHRHEQTGHRHIEHAMNGSGISGEQISCFAGVGVPMDRRVSRRRSSR